MWARGITQTLLFVENVFKGCWFKNHTTVNTLIFVFLISGNVKCPLSSSWSLIAIFLFCCSEILVCKELEEKVLFIASITKYSVLILHEYCRLPKYILLKKKSVDWAKLSLWRYCSKRNTTHLDRVLVSQRIKIWGGQSLVLGERLGNFKVVFSLKTIGQFMIP